MKRRIKELEKKTEIRGPGEITQQKTEKVRATVENCQTKEKNQKELGIAITIRGAGRAVVTRRSTEGADEMSRLTTEKGFKNSFLTHGRRKQGKCQPETEKSKKNRAIQGVREKNTIGHG